MSQSEELVAPGTPGLEPRWTSSAKSGVGTALDARSRIWFTISHGIVDEVYYPRVDQANTRDFGLIVTGANGFFSEEKRDTASTVHRLGPGVPGYRLVNRCVQQRYEIEKTIITDPERAVLLQRIRFRALAGVPGDYRMFVLLAPHIGNQGYGNDGWVDSYKGIPMLFARRTDVSLALACDAGWCAASVGYVGVNDGWRQVKQSGRLTEQCEYVVIAAQSPTVEPATLVLAELADATVMIAQHGETKLRDAERAGTRLRRVGGAVLGVLSDPAKPGAASAAFVPRASGVSTG